VAERRHTPRTEIELACVLRRRRGSAINAQTRNLCPGGMCVFTPRPLALDEVLEFHLPLAGAESVAGRARVLRHEGHGEYALRFERLPEPARARLQGLTEAG
jgi:hypothetical protein